MRAAAASISTSSPAAASSWTHSRPAAPDVLIVVKGGVATTYTLQENGPVIGAVLEILDEYQGARPYDASTRGQLIKNAATALRLMVRQAEGRLW